MAKKAEKEESERPKHKSNREQYRNWFLLLGVVSGIAVGLAAGSILINQDSEKTYLESRQEVLIRQDALESEFSESQERTKEIQKNNSIRDKAIDNLRTSLQEGFRSERAYTDNKRLRIWREIDRLNKVVKAQQEEIDDLRDDFNRSTDQQP